MTDFNNFSYGYKPMLAGSETANRSPLARFRKLLKKPKFSKPNFGGFDLSKKAMLVLAMAFLTAVALTTFILISGSRNQTVLSASKEPIQSADPRFALNAPKKSQTINREFEFPLRDSKGQEVAKIKYLIESAQLRDEILVKGQRATAIKDKTFLILNLKVTNGYSKPVEINTRDYIRFVLGDGREQQAADIHNDPVVTQAESTKLTRIGLTINDTDVKKIKLLIGEIKGEKQTIDIQF